MNRQYHYIYKITRDDCRYYIGMHSTNNLDDGYFGSGKYLRRSIKKYGIEKHKKEILEYLSSRTSLKERERQLVSEEILNDPMCMNLQLGGGGGFIDEEHFVKWFIGGHPPKGSKEASDKGIKAAATIRERRKDSEYRKWHSETISNSTKGIQNFLEKKHTEETKAKMKATKAERNFGQGEKNSQYGTCWVNNGVKAIKIKKDLLDKYLANGYLSGRKLESESRRT